MTKEHVKEVQKIFENLKSKKKTDLNSIKVSLFNGVRL